MNLAHLIDELADVLSRKKLAKSVAATGLTVPQMLANYRKVITLVTARQLPQQVSPDADDDAVLATAQAAKADLIVSGDRKHLLILKRFEGIPIMTAAQAVATRVRQFESKNTHFSPPPPVFKRV